MTPKQMKYMALIGLMVVVLFLATFMSMGVTEGLLRNEEKCGDPTKPLLLVQKSHITRTCVSACPEGYSVKNKMCVLNPTKVKKTPTTVSTSTPTTVSTSTPTTPTTPTTV